MYFRDRADVGANWRPCSWGTLGAPPHRTRDHVRRAVLGAPQLTHLAAIRVESNAVRVPAHAGPIPAAWRREEQVVTVAWPELLARLADHVTWRIADPCGRP